MQVAKSRMPPTCLLHAPYAPSMCPQCVSCLRLFFENISINVSEVAERVGKVLEGGD